MSRGVNQGRPRSWDTWAWIWAKLWASAEGMGWVVDGAGGTDVVVVSGAMVIVGTEVVPRDGTLCPPSPARMTTMASPVARRATARAIRATRGAGMRIAGHRTGATVAFR